MSTSFKLQQWSIAFIFAASMAFAPFAVQPAAAAEAASATLYVSPTGNDANTCQAADAACATINGAIGKAAAGDTILIGVGTYVATSGTVVITIDRDITLSGGWNADFTLQIGRSTVDGQAAFRGITINDGKIVTIDRFVVQNGSDSSQGGGIKTRGILTLNNSIITHNTSGWMGGGINVYGTLTVNNSTISDNTAGDPCCSGGGGGGGIEVYSGTATFNNTTISGNKIVGSFSGSAIDAFGSVFLNNVTVSGNTGAQAITTSGGHLVLNNTTITGNSGGIGSNGVVSMRNSILAENSRSGNPANCSGTIGSAGYNLIDIANIGCTFNAVTGDQAGTPASPIAAMLGPLQDNGGPTFTHGLLRNSPALDAGNPAEPGSGGNACISTDQRGLPRSLSGEGLCDIGAFEFQLPVVVSVQRGNPTPTSAASVDFIVTFSAGVSGVDTTAPFSDFALTTSGISDAAITGVTGSGSSYTVSVSTGTANGTIRLDVVDDDTIVDASSGKPLGGPGAGNGNFVDGQSYTVQGPVVTAITRVDPSPTYLPTIHFTVTFSTPVTGVDTTAPFSDFGLTTTGVSGAAVLAVTGSEGAYSVTVSTGNGNGTIRLDVMDDDTILDAASGKPLGGLGMGNGNYLGGPVYSITKTAIPQAPSGLIWDTTPTFRWSKAPQATQYRYQLIKGTTTVYTKTVLASACGTTCSNTPTTILASGSYKWRVQGMQGGVWLAYSPYKSFTLPLYASKPGHWSGSWVDFYVAPSHTAVDNFAIHISVNGCGNYKITHSPLVSISTTGKFSFTGSFYANGTFSKLSSSAPSATGTAGLKSFYVAGCGYLTGGPYPWSAKWVNFTQPAVVSLSSLDSVLSLSPLEMSPGSLIIDSVDSAP